MKYDEKLLRYFDILKMWNRHINLISTKSQKDFFSTHIEDCLQIIPFINGRNKVIDLGTGAGLPGILIKIVIPEAEVVLIESKRKKAAFCDEAIRKLELKDIRTVLGRVENEASQRLAGRADIVVSRAAWELGLYLKLARNYVLDKGQCISMKGSNWKKEMEDAQKDIAKSGFKLESANEYILSNGKARCLLIFKQSLQ